MENADNNHARIWSKLSRRDIPDARLVLSEAGTHTCSLQCDPATSHCIIYCLAIASGSVCFAHFGSPSIAPVHSGPQGTVRILALNKG